MPLNPCRQCGDPIAAPGPRPGRAPVYCSPRCRQQAYRSRQYRSADQSAERLIAEIQQQANRLSPQPPMALDAGVQELAALVRRLRRVARDVAPLPDPDIVTQVSETISVPRQATGDDGSGFALEAERFRPELRVHCYRMLGSFDEAEDQVQETFLRAWRARDGLTDATQLRAWLYKIATNACLDALKRQPRIPRPFPTTSPAPPPGTPTEIAWLQPYPDLMLDAVTDPRTGPETAAVDRETIELAFMAAIQHLPPKQRAVLIARDVLGWPAKETAALLDMTVASVGSALQRARPALRDKLPRQREDWGSATTSVQQEQAILERYMAATDIDALTALLSEDAKLTMPPNPVWVVGREAIAEFLRPVFDQSSPQYFGQWRHLPAGANRQPAVAGYVQRPGTTVYRAQVLDVLRVVDAQIVEITSFEPHLFAAFGLPPTL